MLQDQKNIRDHIRCYNTPQLKKLKSNLVTLQNLLSQEVYSSLNEDMNRLSLPRPRDELKKDSPSENLARGRKRNAGVRIRRRVRVPGQGNSRTRR